MFLASIPNSLPARSPACQSLVRRAGASAKAGEIPGPCSAERTSLGRIPQFIMVYPSILHGQIVQSNELSWPTFHLLYNFGSSSVTYNTYLYVESQVPISQRESDIKRPMLLRTAPISKINLLLADIPFWIAAASFHILKAWARSLLGSRHHHLIMSCK